MTARPGLPKKLGTNLDYKVQERNSVGLGNGKKPLMSRNMT